MQAQFDSGHPEMVDYTPAVAIVGGQVVITNDRPRVAHRDMAVADGLGALASYGGVYKMTADGAIAADKKVYWDATNFKVTLTAGANKHFGYTVTSAALDGDVIYVQHFPEGGTGEGTSTEVATVAAAGNAQGNATLVAPGFTLVTGADAAKGVILPLATGKQVVTIKNEANAVLKIYPGVGDVINTLAANASLDIAARTSVQLTSYDATTWYSLPLLPS